MQSGACRMLYIRSPPERNRRIRLPLGQSHRRNSRSGFPVVPALDMCRLLTEPLTRLRPDHSLSRLPSPMSHPLIALAVLTRGQDMIIPVRMFGEAAP